MQNNQTRRLCIVLALTFMISAPICGQEDANSAAAGAGHDGAPGVRIAPVVIDGQTLFLVRGASAFPAERRAREIERRIKSLAADRNFDPASLKLEDRDGATWILANGARIVAVIDEDASIEQISRGSLADLYHRRIREAIEAYRHDRTTSSLAWAAFYAFLATVLLVASARVGRRLVAVVRGSFERRYQERIRSFEGRSLNIVKVEQIWRALTGLLNLVWGIGVAVVLVAYLDYLLALFPWTRALGKSLLYITIDPLRTMGLGFIGVVPNLVFLAILVFVARGGLKIIRLIFDGLASGTVKFDGFDPDWAWPTYRLVRILVIALAMVVAYPYIPGSESAAFKGVSLFMGVIFSLGSSSLIGNFIAGYSMTYRRAFRIGDRVKIGEHIGDVEQVRLLVTHLRTPKNEEVIVPNSSILSSEVMNFSSLARERGLILHTTVGIGYETPWRQVEAMLLDAAARTEGLMRKPAPFVLQNALGDFSVIYEINVYCDTPQQIPAHYAALHRNILDVFNEYGVQIMTPAYEGDPGQPKVVPKDQWYAAPAVPPESAQPALSAR